MYPWQERTAIILSEESLDRLATSRVAIVGLGGVGAYAAEMLVRAGVGNLLLVDSDCVTITNKNRQLLALDSTMGRPKTEVMAERLRDINPEVKLDTVSEYLTGENAAAILGPWRPDFVVDAIDTLTPKVELIKYCVGEHLPMVSSMGSGAKRDMTKIRIADLSKSHNCPLAYMLRKRLRKEGISKGVTVVYSEELPDRVAIIVSEDRNKKSQAGTLSYLPASFGCACAQAALESLITLPQP
ncbi:MAG: tRNA threonylcarbamoyladenosine dehydratase [Bacteroidales bacterium]|nr:tRNA threonylcarbamoyladenosine dehydratase [Bacteroidales bacterium]